MSEEKAIAHLEVIRQDIRDEIKKRIEQRDRYSIQLISALGALVTVAFSSVVFPTVTFLTTDLGMVLIAAPIATRLTLQRHGHGTVIWFLSTTRQRKRLTKNLGCTASPYTVPIVERTGSLCGIMTPDKMLPLAN